MTLSGLTMLQLPRGVSYFESSLLQNYFTCLSHNVWSSPSFLVFKIFISPCSFYHPIPPPNWCWTVSGANSGSVSTNPPPSLSKTPPICSVSLPTLPSISALSASVLTTSWKRLYQCPRQCRQRHQDQHLCGGLHHVPCSAQALWVSEHPPGTSPLLWYGQCDLPMASQSTLHHHGWFSGGHDGWIRRGRHHRVCFWGR